jgi:hypothetical protein
MDQQYQGTQPTQHLMQTQELTRRSDPHQASSAQGMQEGDGQQTGAHRPQPSADPQHAQSMQQQVHQHGGCRQCKQDEQVGQQGGSQQSLHGVRNGLEYDRGARYPQHGATQIARPIELPGNTVTLPFPQKTGFALWVEARREFNVTSGRQPDFPGALC